MKTVKSLFHGKQAFPLMKLLFNPFPQPFVVCLGVDTGTRAGPGPGVKSWEKKIWKWQNMQYRPLNIDLGAEPKQKSVYSWMSRFLHKIMTKICFHRVVRNLGSFHGSTRGQNGLLGSVRWFYSRLRRQFQWCWRQCSFDPPDRSTNSKIIKRNKSEISSIDSSPFFVSTLDFELKNFRRLASVAYPPWRPGRWWRCRFRGLSDIGSWLPKSRVQIITECWKRAWISWMSVSSRTDYMIMCTSMSSYWRKRRMVPFFTHLDLLLLKISQSPTPIP